MSSMSECIAMNGWTWQGATRPQKTIFSQNFSLLAAPPLTLCVLYPLRVTMGRVQASH